MVDHEGKKELLVYVDKNNIDFEYFYREMTNKIQENIKLDGYVDAIRSDFSTTTATHRIVSEITVMSSMQQYFSYVMGFQCGIPYIEFLGTEDDWKNLKIKLLKVKKLLEPIEKEINLGQWWADVELICDKLHDSVKGNADIEWWSNIIRITKSNSFGSGGPDVVYDGWFLTKLLNKRSSVTSLGHLPSGLVSVALTIDDNGCRSKAAIVSGIAGFKIDESKELPVVQSAHGWTIFSKY